MMGIHAAFSSIHYSSLHGFYPRGRIPWSGPETGMGVCCFPRQSQTLCTSHGLSALLANVRKLPCSLSVQGHGFIQWPVYTHPQMAIASKAQGENAVLLHSLSDATLSLRRRLYQSFSEGSFGRAPFPSCAGSEEPLWLRHAPGS